MKRKAVAIIALHLPQLNPKVRAHIESLAHKAMGGENIGNKLKASLQELSQSKGRAKGSMLDTEESPQPQRTDNRGKGIFASMLQRSATAFLRSGTTNPASSPYTPIKLEDYSAYGGKMKTRAQWGVSSN